MMYLSYETLFDDYAAIDITDFVKDVPCFAALL